MNNNILGFEDSVFAIIRDGEVWKLFRKLGEKERVRAADVWIDENLEERWIYLFAAPSYEKLEECVGHYRLINKSFQSISLVAAGVYDEKGVKRMEN